VSAAEIIDPGILCRPALPQQPFGNGLRHFVASCFAAPLTADIMHTD